MLRSRFSVFGIRDFRIFYAGYATSLLGSAMARIALIFAVLDSGGTATDLGYVFAAAVFPQVLVMLAGGVIADRLGRKPVMLVTDASRLVVQGTLAGALFAGSPPIWLFMLLSALLSIGEGCFNPALAGLRAEIARPAIRADANALLGVAQSATAVLGPALAGALVALAGPAVVIALDAASFGVSVLALARLSIPLSRPTAAGQSPWLDLADGWRVFTSQTWLWVGTLQFTLFNLFTWAPYLLLGPILAGRYMGGAKAWGVITATYAAGAVLAGLLLVGRAKAKRPLVVAVVGTFGYPVPVLLLALQAPAWAVAGGALVAGGGSAVFGTLFTTVIQQRIPQDMLGRVNAFMLTGSYSLGAAGYAVIGVIAGAVGLTRLLGFAAAYATASSVVVLALPAIRSVRWRDQAGAAGGAAATPESAPATPAAG